MKFECSELVEEKYFADNACQSHEVQVKAKGSKI